MKTSCSEILLSFVLPVYNVEGYLPECVDSILQQMNGECEMVLVDDGSTDASGTLCLAYAQRDPRIRVIQKENGGLSSARNAGLAAAEGRYVTFVDSDDKLFPGCVSQILAWIKTEGTDLCFLQAAKLYPDGTITDLGEGIRRSGLKGKTREEAIAHLTSRPKYPGSAWAKLFRRSFLIDNQLHFPYDRRYSEDLGFILDCIMRARDFDVLDVPYYQYRQNRKGSITSSISARNFYDLLRFIRESAEKLTDGRQSRDPVCGALMGFVAYEYSVLLLLYGALPEADKKQALQELRAYRWTLGYAVSKKEKLIAFVCGLFGIGGTSFLLKQYRKAVEK